MQSTRTWLIGIALTAMLAGTALAAPAWQIEGTRNQIYLLGSVHFLRATDEPLSASLMAKHAAADVVVFEIDLGQLDPIEIAATMQRIAIDPHGRDLADLLGEDAYRQATALAADIDIDLAALRPYEPWFVALQITQIRLGQLGYDGTHGIEAQLAKQTAIDNKTTAGLETLEEQLTALDSLPVDVQQAFLMQTLEDAAEIDADLDRIVAAWRSADTRTLEEELLAGLKDFPALYDSILVNRNRAWTQQIIDFVDRPSNYFIVVGALHLVGDDSVIHMLEQAGYRARPLPTPPN